MAITLAGSGNDRVDFGDIAAIAGATAITVAVTLKPSAINAATNNRVIHQWASSTFGAFLIQVVDTDELGFTVRNGSSLYGPKTTALNLTAGNTYRIVARIGGLGGTKTQSIWVNGSAATTTAWFSGSPASIQNSTSSVQIGHETAETSDGVDGDYSEAAIWLESVPDWVAEAYGQGYTALVYQKNQLLYAPLENTSRTNDIVGGLTGTLTGGATADHPRIIYPAWPEIILSAAAAADSSGAGSSSGSSTVAGAGASINAQAGASAGSASVSGVGASIHEAAGASAGTATVSGVGDSTSAGSAAGSSAGTATVAGVGASVHTAVGTAAGSSTAGGVSSAIERMTSGGLSRSRNRNRKRYLINGRVYRLTQSELVELLAQRRGDVKPETIKVERSQKPRLNRNRMTAQPTGSVDRRRRASIEITLNPMETQFKPLTKADYMALAEAVEMLIDEQDMMDLLAYL
jgi:hypothetical protein